MREQAVEQLEAHADHDADEDLEADAAAAGVQIRERQCQRHHHENCQWIDEFFPERDFIALGMLVVFLQVPGIGPEIVGRHAIRIGEQHRQDFGGDLRHQVALRRSGRRGRIGDCRDGGILRDRGGVGEAGLGHVHQTPAVGALVAGLVGVDQCRQAEVTVELVELDADQLAVGLHLLGVDEA